MYRMANALVEAAMNNGAQNDIRITCIAFLRCISSFMAVSEWGRTEGAQQQMATLLPLYVKAAIESNDTARLVKPFSKLI